jgi:hypothetical protein
MKTGFVVASHETMHIIAKGSMGHILLFKLIFEFYASTYAS